MIGELSTAWLAQLPVDSQGDLAEWGRILTDYPLRLIGVILVPLFLLAVLGKLFPTPLVLRWGTVVALLSTSAALSGQAGWTAMLAMEASVIWLVANWFPRVPQRSSRVLYRAVCAIALGLALPLFGNVGAVLVLDLVLVAILVVDLFTVPTHKTLTVQRQVLKIVSLKKRHDVQLHIVNHRRRRLQFELRDDVPQEFDALPERFDIRLKPQTRMSFKYQLIASRRGEYPLNRVHVRFRSLLGLWHRYTHYPVKSTLNVYPDMKQLGEYAVLARTNRLSLLGVKRTRRVGQDNEFERLRDYSVDDNFRHIDWRATARRNKLTVKDFQVNQSQRLIFMLDCGRMMTNEAQGISLLDHSINAMLMASYVALRQGDSVGLICFSDRVHSYVPPRGGMKQMNQLLHSVFNRHPQMVESRYDEAFLYLRTHCLKRSLVVMISNVIDEINSMQVEQYLSTLVGRHLPLGVLLRDHRLFDAAETRPTKPLEAFTAAAAAEILSWRHQLLVDLTHRGVLALDVYPEDMTAPLVNQYLQIKARHLL